MTFIDKANMANGMVLNNQKTHFIVAEQGNVHTPSSISKINLSTKKRVVIVSDYKGKPFNSLNKVIETKKAGFILVILIMVSIRPSNPDLN